jgi:hypothetical protein
MRQVSVDARGKDFGRIDRTNKADVCNALRSDTPTHLGVREVEHVFLAEPTRAERTLARFQNLEWDTWHFWFNSVQRFLDTAEYRRGLIIGFQRHVQIGQFFWCSRRLSFTPFSVPLTCLCPGRYVGVRHNSPA